MKLQILRERLAKGEIVEDRWNEVKYIATDSPITIDQMHKGHVYMLAHTDYVRRTLDQLSNQFYSQMS